MTKRLTEAFSSFQLFRIDPIGGVVFSRLLLNGSLSCFQLFRIDPIGGERALGEVSLEGALGVSNYSELTQSVGFPIVAVEQLRKEGSFQLFRIDPIGGEVTLTVQPNGVIQPESFQLFRIDPIGGEILENKLQKAVRVSNYSELTQSVGKFLILVEPT